ncbi:hypothetical protein [Bacteroides ovatus]|uniref:hypothetical protein n=1 Tax=Bacteroides ovatus TaxID=28116 RepID=UPI00234D621C|nr:hypothetical protein [Bacteroides ovatus]MDC7147583.1 hypothetical protein [Bacteroides ovatus]
MYNGYIIKDLLDSRRIPNKALLEYISREKSGNSALKQIIEGNPTVKRLEPVADFFQVSMDTFFDRQVSFTPVHGHIVGNGNAIGNGNTITTVAENEYKTKIENLERLLEEKEKRIKTLETLVSVLQNRQ